MSDGILSGPFDVDAPPSTKPVHPQVAATLGLVVEHASGVTGAIVVFAGDQGVIVRDAHGRDHRLPNVAARSASKGGPSGWSRRREITRPRPLAVRRRVRWPSVERRPVSPASRIYVEGIHDAELIEKIWGEDLRIEGVVVEPMHGMDDLEAIVRSFGPRSGRRLGILLDHYVEGSKEWRAGREIDHPDVAVRGHEFVDVWAAVRPSILGLEAWPVVPMGEPWKLGVCSRLGVDEPGRFWRGLLGRVERYGDLHHSLVGSVEALIDFVTEH